MDTAIPADKPSAIPSADRWVTLRELAEIRGISQHSAARLVRRHGWRRQRDNQGRVRALVPPEALDKPSAGPDGSSDSPSAGPEALTAAIAPVVTLLREQLDHERGRADRAEAARDNLQTRLEAAQVELSAARIEVEQFRQAEAARKAASRWARLRAAWRRG
jgi:hypothetical protein